MVGCVIVKEDTIIGEGWHQQYGGPHAEVNAVSGVKETSGLKGATVYVNLEPCSHFGKTPPCADLLIRSGVRKVVVSNMDVNPLVAGNGIRKLREAGIEVITGIREREGRALNVRFFTSFEKQRPYIILKWAQTADGFMARENYESKWISNEYARQLVHKWRGEEDAVWAGTRTASHDNPQLNVRDWTGRNPVRVVVDRFLRLPEKLKLFDGTQPTILFNTLKHEEHHNLVLVRVDDDNFLVNALHQLTKRNIQSVLVEGGAFTLNEFIRQGLWDEARVFTSPQVFGKGIRAPQPPGAQVGLEKVHSDLLTTYSWPKN
jgi:diaminohydroxyphosphoribosylaminopyrimidine deaminase/5-amino-6-(5-phosphoribosylamino)uracil reductase